MANRPVDNRTKAERRRDAIYGERPTGEVQVASPRSLQLGAQGFFSGDCSRCPKLKRPQAHGAVRHIRATDGPYAISHRHGYLCAVCSDEVAAELGGAWKCSQCGGVSGPEHAKDHWNPASVTVTWHPLVPEEIGTTIPIINRHHG